MYLLGIWFVSGICVWIPCIKERMMIIMMIMMMMMMMKIIIIIIIIIIQKGSLTYHSRQLFSINKNDTNTTNVCTYD